MQGAATPKARRIAANIAKLPGCWAAKLTSRQLLYGTIWKARCRAHTSSTNTGPFASPRRGDPSIQPPNQVEQVKLMRILSFEELKSLKHIAWNKEHIAKLVIAGLFPPDSLRRLARVAH